MRRLLPIFILLFLATYIVRAESCTPANSSNCSDCPPGDIVLNSQIELNDFVMDYPNCTEIPGSLTVSGFYGPNNFAGLSQVTTVGGTLRISSNVGLDNLVGFDNLVSVGGDLIIYNNQTLTSLTGLENLSSVGNDLGLYFNRWLTDLRGLDNLATVGGLLECYTNRDLINFSGLESLTSVERLSITYNESLTSLTGLQNIDYTAIPTVGWGPPVRINNNPQLSECAIQPICNYLAIPDIYTQIHSNAVGCDSQGEVQIACFGCLPDGITITTQSQIDNFASDYPGCSTIPGDVIIQGGANITNLQGLAQITNIEGSLGLYDNTSLVNLNGLDNLISVGATLELSGNDLLTDLSGLGSLTSVGAELEIKNSQALLNLNGLNSLTSVGDYVRIYNNPMINSLTGLENLTTIGGDLQIWINNVLPSLDGLDNLSSIGAVLSIEGNPTLNDLSALSNITHLPGGLYLVENAALSSLNALINLTTIDGYLLVLSNPSLTNFQGLNNISSIGSYVFISQNSSLNNLNGLENLVSVGGYFNITDNPILTNVQALAALSTVGGYLGFLENPTLASLLGLQNLNSVGGDLYVFENASLVNLSGLESLSSINGAIVVADNASLTSLNGIQNIDPASIQSMSSSLQDLEIYNNPLLSDCAIQSICDFLALPMRTTNINGNGGACDTRTAIEQACTPLEVVCQNLTIAADCQVVVDAIDFDNGSTGAGTLHFSVSPEGPYPVGLTTVTLTVSDDNTTSSCTATILVEGLPCPWTATQTGINCAEEVETSYDPETAIFGIAAQDCYDPNYYSNSDAQGFIQSAICGDSEIIARVLGGEGQWWGGIAMRESNDPGAKMIQLAVNHKGHVQRKLRSSTGGYAFTHQFQAQGQSWLKITRSGNQFAAYISPDGQQWQLVLMTNIYMDNCIQVGLLLGNAVPGSWASVQFDQVQVTNGAAPLQSPEFQTPVVQSAPQTDFNLYPNPTNGALNVDLSQFMDQQLQLNLINQHGQLIKTKAYLNDHSQMEKLDLQYLPEGVYLIQLKNSTTVWTKKVNLVR